MWKKEGGGDARNGRKRRSRRRVNYGKESITHDKKKGKEREEERGKLLLERKGRGWK